MPIIQELRSYIYNEGFFGNRLRFNQDQLEGRIITMMFINRLLST